MRTFGDLGPQSTLYPSSSCLSSSLFEMEHIKMKDNRTSDNKWSEWPLVYSDDSKKGTTGMKVK